MAEGNIPSEPVKPENPQLQENNLDKFPQVLAGGDSLGWELREQGQEVSIKDIFGRGKTAIPTKEVYFRTVSGNIYHLEKSEDRFKLGNAKTIAEPKTWQGAVPPVSTLEWEAQADNKLTVGKRFFFDPKYEVAGGTSLISEIVVVDKHIAPVQNNLNTRYNTIVEDFQKIAEGNNEPAKPQSPSGTDEARRRGYRPTNF